MSAECPKCLSVAFKPLMNECETCGEHEAYKCLVCGEVVDFILMPALFDKIESNLKYYSEILGPVSKN